MTEPIDWQARKQRALAHTRRLVEEWERARGKKVPPKWIVYDYTDAPRRQGGEEGEG